MIPRLVHVIYFPWDREHRLKADENDFDHAPIEALRQYAPDFEVRLWTYSRARDFCRQHYPEVWDTVQRCPHPTMMVDILRWLVVLHFGGLYWQVSTTPLVPLADLLPTSGKQVRLFTEFVMTPAQCQAMATEPIRNGEPEEPVRIPTQTFAAMPGAPFIRRVLDLILERNRTLVPQRDYDILYIGANAALSTAYDRFGRNDPGVERLDLVASRRLLHWCYLGSWRKETQISCLAAKTGPAPRLDRIPWLADRLYRRVRIHPHETLLRQIDAGQPRTSCLPHLEPVLGKLGIRSVCEAPSGRRGPVPAGIEYTGADPDRVIVVQNRREPHTDNLRFRHASLLYASWPRVDLFICPDFLEWLSYAEVRRVLRRICAARPRYLALTGHSLLNDTWDTALGDFRPLAFHLPPFSFPPPAAAISLPPLMNGRPDRQLQIWSLAEIHARVFPAGQPESSAMKEYP